MPDLLSDLLGRQRAMYARWIRGDTEAYAGPMAPDVVYFDTYTPARLYGVDAVRQHLRGIGQAMRAALQSRGKSQLDRYEIIDPRLQHAGDMAVLTYEWTGYLDGDASAWRATEVFQHRGGAWQIVHAHWSAVQPASAPASAPHRA